MREETRWQGITRVRVAAQGDDPALAMMAQWTVWSTLEARTMRMRPTHRHVESASRVENELILNLLTILLGRSTASIQVLIRPLDPGKGDHMLLAWETWLRRKYCTQAQIPLPPHGNYQGT